MLQRLYGMADVSREALDAVLARMEEAKKRDHRKLGKELDLFSISEEVGPGLAHWHPKGARIRVAIEDYWRREHFRAGYEMVFTPHVGRAKLWETSGHLGFYRDSMFPSMNLSEGEGSRASVESYFVKPMNCPFHIQVYKTRRYSYRDLPLRWAELGTVYRYEKEGVRHGLLRVRGFTQDDAHIFCTPEQIEDEVRSTVTFALRVRAVRVPGDHGLPSTRPKAVGCLNGGNRPRNPWKTRSGPRPSNIRWMRAAARSTARRSTSRSKTRSDVRGNSAPSSSTSTCRSGSR